MSDWRAMMYGSLSSPQYPQNPQKGLSGGHSEDFEDIAEGQTDTTHTLPEPATVSIPSVPVSGIPPEISATQTDGVSLVPPPQYPQNPQNGSGAELGPRHQPPLWPGWKSAYRDQGRLQDGIVRQCIETGRSWAVELSKGHTIPLQRITSVAKTDAQGRVIAAWDTRAHGYDGEGMGRS